MHNLKYRTFSICAHVLFWFICCLLLIALVQAPMVILQDIDSGTTSPTGAYRWLDVANQAYSSAYRNSYNYTQATVTIEYTALGETFNGSLVAANLKPNFAYQLKLVGIPGTTSNEKIGLCGRWWQEEWNGSAWTNGQNLNNKGDGSSPNPNDATYFMRKNITNPTSPTGYKYRYTGYLVFEYFITDLCGNATFYFQANSSYHVLWKTTQRSWTDDDGPQISTTFDVNTSLPAYDVDYPIQNVVLFGEWERLPVGGIFLAAGNYTAEIILTEESFHGDGGADAGNWAGAMGTIINFLLSYGDTTAPSLSAIALTTSSPVDTDPLFGWENFTCTVTDDGSGVDHVSLYLDSSPVLMGNIGSTYYYNTTLASGSTEYYINVSDNVGNTKTSPIETIAIPPNWDVYLDANHRCDGFDVTDLSLQWLAGDGTSKGWSRADINNDGYINGWDVSYFSLYWCEIW